MMGPEAALLTARMAELRGMTAYIPPMMPKDAPLYAEAAARAHLRPLRADEPPVRRRAVVTRLRDALGLRANPRAEPPAEWLVAAAPIASKPPRSTPDHRNGPPLPFVPAGLTPRR